MKEGLTGKFRRQREDTGQRHGSTRVGSATRREFPLTVPEARVVFRVDLVSKL